MGDAAFTLVTSNGYQFKMTPDPASVPHMANMFPIKAFISAHSGGRTYREQGEDEGERGEAT